MTMNIGLISISSHQPKKTFIPIMEIIMEGALPGGASCSNMDWEILHKVLGVGL
jgi:hypothetical protein